MRCYNRSTGRCDECSVKVSSTLLWQSLSPSSTQRLNGTKHKRPCIFTTRRELCNLSIIGYPKLLSIARANKSSDEFLQLNLDHTISVHARGGRPLSLFASCSKRNGACQPKVPATRTDGERDRAIRLRPTLTDNIPDRQVIPRKRDRGLRRLAWLEVKVCETFQNRGRFVR